MLAAVQATADWIDSLAAAPMVLHAASWPLATRHAVALEQPTPDVRLTSALRCAMGCARSSAGSGAAAARTSRGWRCSTPAAGCDSTAAVKPLQHDECT